MLGKVSLQLSKFLRDLSREFHAMAKCVGKEARTVAALEFVDRFEA